MRVRHPLLLMLDTLWFVGIAGVELGLADAARRWADLFPLMVFAAVVVFLATACAEFFLILDDEDWWDDLRTQTRNLVLVPLAQIAAVGGGWWLGWRIAG
jgi:hypothetical protein